MVGCTESIPARAESGKTALKTLPSAPDPSDAELYKQFTLPEPTPSNPIVAAMKFHPLRASTGGNAELLVYVRIARAHYVHVRSQTFSPLEVSVKLPEGLDAQGTWRYPRPESAVGAERVYRNALLLRLPVRVNSKLAESKLNVSGKLSFQVCTDELCWPSQSVEVSAPFIIESVGGSP